MLKSSEILLLASNKLDHKLFTNYRDAINDAYEDLRTSALDYSSYVKASDEFLVIYYASKERWKKGFDIDQQIDALKETAKYLAEGGN